MVVVVASGEQRQRQWQWQQEDDDSESTRGLWKRGPQKRVWEGTKISCGRLTLGKKKWMRSKSSVTAPATCFECYDGTGKEMGGRRFRRWVGCILWSLKVERFFVRNWFPPNSVPGISIRTVLCNRVQRCELHK